MPINSLSLVCVEGRVVSEFEDEMATSVDEHCVLDYIRQLVLTGGPPASEYGRLLDTLNLLASLNVPAKRVRDALSPVLTVDTMQGFGLLKPHGYAGDFEMIDRIYRLWISPHEERANWDRFFHAQPAPRAVRNRKNYFHHLVARALQRHSEEVSILNCGSGPARDVAESLHQTTATRFVCVDLDQKALDYARVLCDGQQHRVVFLNRNVVRLRMNERFTLIWCGGLFDYFSDRLFVLVLRRLYSLLHEDGELVIGNFSEANPSRLWMEQVGDWYLQHRSVPKLLELAVAAGIDRQHVSVGSEPEKVNLFLHVLKSRSGR